LALLAMTDDYRDYYGFHGLNRLDFNVCADAIYSADEWSVARDDAMKNYSWYKMTFFICLNGYYGFH
jgi:hypothetical protein